MNILCYPDVHIWRFISGLVAIHLMKLFCEGVKQLKFWVWASSCGIVTFLLWATQPVAISFQWWAWGDLAGPMLLGGLEIWEAVTECVRARHTFSGEARTTPLLLTGLTCTSMKKPSVPGTEAQAEQKQMFYFVRLFIAWRVKNKCLDGHFFV